MTIEPTHEERLAILALKRVARRWPESLWLFSADGSLCVMRAGPHGKHMMTRRHGGVDQEYTLDHVDIPNDGGDF